MWSKKNPSQWSKTKFQSIEISKNGDDNSNRKSNGRNFGLQKQYLKKENNNAMLTLGICREETKHNEKCKYWRCESENCKEEDIFFCRFVFYQMNTSFHLWDVPIV